MYDKAEDFTLIMLFLALICSNFKELAKDSEQMRQFHNYLESEGHSCETLLLFWLAVRDLKPSMANPGVYSRKMERIVGQFFRDSETRKGVT